MHEEQVIIFSPEAQLSGMNPEEELYGLVCAQYEPLIRDQLRIFPFFCGPPYQTKTGIIFDTAPPHTLFLTSPEEIIDEIVHNQRGPQWQISRDGKQYKLWKPGERRHLDMLCAMEFDRGLGNSTHELGYPVKKLILNLDPSAMPKVNEYLKRARYADIGHLTVRT